MIAPNKKMSINNNGGFTLIEIMMVVSLLGIASLIFYNFLSLNFKFLDQTDTNTASYFQATTAMYHITRDAQQYQSLQIKKSANDYIICGNGDERKFINVTTITDNSSYYYSTAQSGQIGQLIGSESGVLIDNVKTSIDLLEQNLTVNNNPDSDPDTGEVYDINFIRITLEVFPTNQSTTNSIKLSRVIRLSHK